VVLAAGKIKKKTPENQRRMREESDPYKEIISP